MVGRAKRGLKSIVCAGIIGLALAGGVKEARATIVPFDSNSIVKDYIEYYIQTDKSIYNLGENVEMLYRVTNMGVEDVTFEFPYSPEWNFWVEKDGEHIWRAVNGWWTAQTQFTLSPSESREFPSIAPPYIWNMRDDENNLVDEGQYNVIGGLHAGVGGYEYTKVSVPITIVPEPGSLALLGVGLLFFNKKRES